MNLNLDIDIITGIIYRDKHNMVVWKLEKKTGYVVTTDSLYVAKSLPEFLSHLLDDAERWKAIRETKVESSMSIPPLISTCSNTNMTKNKSTKRLSPLKEHSTSPESMSQLISDDDLMSTCNFGPVETLEPLVHKKKLSPIKPRYVSPRRAGKVMNSFVEFTPQKFQPSLHIDAYLNPLKSKSYKTILEPIN